MGLLTPDVLGRGLGTEVTRLVLAHAFGDLELSALTVRVLEFNSRAIACYARCGFRLERREADAVTLGGAKYADLIMRLDSERYWRLVRRSGGAWRGARSALGQGQGGPAEEHAALVCSYGGILTTRARARAAMRRGTASGRRRVVMSGSDPKHLEPGEAGTESHDAQGALVGGGRIQPYLSASMFADANEGSRNKRRPWVWALAWVGGFAGAIAILILIVR